MMRIFNREQGKQHPLFSALKDMQAKDRLIHAQACNVKHEARVTQEREEAFLGFLGECKDADHFEERRKDYLNKRIKLTAAPEFVEEPWARKEPPPGENLVSLLVLNGLDGIFQWARDQAKGVTVGKAGNDFQFFYNYPRAPKKRVGNVKRDAGKAKAEKEKLEFVSGWMQTDRHGFLQAVFRLHDRYKKSQPYHPIWLTRWSSFEEIRRGGDDPDRWCHFVGVCTENKKGHWVVVLKFEPSEISQLYSPTVLDGDNPFFFPTPEGSAAHSGLAMDLAMTGTKPAYEYIALYPSLPLAQVCGCQKLREQAADDIKAIRNYHVSQLRNEFRSKQSIAWLDRVGGEWDPGSKFYRVWRWILGILGWN